MHLGNRFRLRRLFVAAYVPVVMGLTSCATSPAKVDASLLTVAETSGFRATARYAEVNSFLSRLTEQSHFVQVGELGVSPEGRSIPLLIVADPPIASPQEAKKSDKLVVFAFGNIHAGEVCGKEALLMLARELATRPNHPLLDDLIVLLAPIYNTDGNEKVSKDNRRNQVGPEEGMGQRANGQGLDLNRDYIKLEAPETRGLVRLLCEWDPAIIIDTHTTNGSRHGYALTYASPRHPAGDSRVIEFVRDELLPAVSRAVERNTGYKSFFYGNFSRDRKRWRPYPAMPRYGTVYRGLRNRLAILTEAYAYASYKDRVRATLAFVRETFQYAAANKGRIQKLLADVDARAVEVGSNPSVNDRVAIRTKPAPFDKLVEVAGFVEVTNDEGRRQATGEPRTYQLEYFGRSVPTLSVRRPYAYLIPPSRPTVVEKLQQHGVIVQRLQAETEATVEVYRITSVKRAERAFQNHRYTSVEAVARTETRPVPAGTFVVKTAQPLGSLAAFLLEPQAEDGLTTWNFFDEGLETGRDFPVLRLVQPAQLPLPSRTLK